MSFTQDFNTTILKKSNHGDKSVKYTNTNLTTGINLNAIEQDKSKPPKVTIEMSKIIQKARSDKKMTQSDLAKSCNLNIQIIKSYENTSAIAKQNELIIINRVLATQLKMPKVEKIYTDA